MPKIKYTSAKGLVQSSGAKEVVLQGAFLKCTDVATDAWGAVKPVMIPGLHKNLKVFNLDAHTGMHEAVFGNVGANTHIFETDTDNSSAVAALANDADFTDGALTLKTGNSSGNQTCLSTAAIPFKCVAGKQWWIETAFKLDDHDVVEFFFGLTERATDVNDFHTTAAGSGTDRVGFVKKAHNVDAVEFAVTHNAAGTVGTGLDTGITYAADNQILSLGIHWDGTKINFYTDSVTTGTTPGNLVLNTSFNDAVPSDAGMRLVLLVVSANNVETATINYLRGAYEV